MKEPTPYHEDRPWGSFDEYTLNQKSTVKILNVKSGQENSLQSHHERDEFWEVLDGSCELVIGEEHVQGAQGDRFWSPRGTKHRIHSTEGCRILEIAFGDFDEEDIDRFEDKYGRA